jgi:two-component system LytT family response regulator
MGEKVILENDKTGGANFLCGGKVTRIIFAEITHIGLMAGIMTIYSGRQKYETDYDIAEVMKRLPPGDFVRINRDFIVAPAHIDRIEDYKVIIGRYKLSVNYFYRTRLLAALKKSESKSIVQIKTHKP